MEWWWFSFSCVSLRRENGCGHQVPVQYFPHHLHLLWTVCLWHARGGGRAEMETALWLPGDVWISTLVSLLYICVSARREKLWQTKLDSVGGVNSITFFFSLFAAHFWIGFSPSSKASQMDTCWKGCLEDVSLNIYMRSNDSCLTRMSVNVQSGICKIRELQRCPFNINRILLMPLCFASERCS